MVDGADVEILGGVHPRAVRAVVLVEGLSDRVALEVLARRRGRNLEDEAIRIVAMGGATNIGHYLDRFGPHGLGVRVAGLYDSAEERFFRQGLERAGLGTGPESTSSENTGSENAGSENAGSENAGPENTGSESTGLDGAGLDRAALEERGFFVCTADLEDELIRAVGAERVQQLVEAAGELASFRRLQRQPAQRERSLHDQLRRLMSGRSGGKYRYAAILAQAVDLDRVPRPLDALLDWL